MSKQPIYRLASMAAPSIEDNVPKGPAKQWLSANIKIPDVLPIGSTIHVEYQTVGEDGTMIDGGAFFKVADKHDPNCAREGGLVYVGT